MELYCTLGASCHKIVMKKGNKEEPEGRLAGWGSAYLGCLKRDSEGKTEADPAVRSGSLGALTKRVGFF